MSEVLCASARQAGYLESGSLSCPCLLLDRHDLHDFILEGRPQELLNNLIFLDWHGEQVDLLQALDLALHQSVCQNAMW